MTGETLDLSARDGSADDLVLTFPGIFKSDPPASALKKRINSVFAVSKGVEPTLVPGEQVTAISVDLPVRGRARQAALSFAIEDDIASPLSDVHVALCRSMSSNSAPNRVLAAIISRSVMEALPGDRPILPEFVAIPCPTADQNGTAWSVWREGTRAVVRVSDGTGFAVRADMLEMLWQQAGRPSVTSLGAALPAGMRAEDRSANPPPPDHSDLAIDLRQGDFAPAGEDWIAPLRRTAILVAAGLAAHMAVAGIDLISLKRIAAVERGKAEAALNPILPGAAIGSDAAPILARLSPRPPESAGSGFLPILSEASTSILGSGPSIAVTRLIYSGEDNSLSMHIETATLDDLQRIEQTLNASGFLATKGAATAGDGVAEAEFRIRRRSAQ